LLDRQCSKAVRTVNDLANGRIVSRDRKREHMETEVRESRPCVDRRTQWTRL